MSPSNASRRDVPPKLADRLLEKACPKSRLELVRADLAELFERTLQARGLRAARRRYWREVLILAWVLPLGGWLYAPRLHRTLGAAGAAAAALKETTMTALQELHFAIRRLRRRPGLFVAAVLVLAIGIAAETVVFSLINGVLLRPLPFPESDRIHAIFRARDGGGVSAFSPGTALELKNRLSSFQRMTVYQGESAFLETPERLVRLSGVKADPDLLPLFGFSPALGRNLGESDPRAAVLIGYDVWQRHFGADPSIAGRQLTLSGEPHTVIGVLPPDFQMPGFSPELVISHDEELDPAERRWGAFYVSGRLKPDATIDQAQAELEALSAALAEAHPETERGWACRAVPVFDRVVSESDRRVLFTLQILTGLVLLVCSINVAVLLLSKCAEDEREVAVRLALGSGWRRIAGRFLSEAGLIGAGGVLLGGLLAWWTLQPLPSLLPIHLPRMTEVAFDWRVALVCGLLGVLISILCGAASTVSILRSSPIESLKGSAMGSQRPDAALFRKGLVAVELALAVVLVAGAGLMVRTIQQLQHTELGFDTANLVAARLILPSYKYGSGEGGRDPSQVYERLLGAAAAVPGVLDAALTLDMPLQSGGMFYPWAREEAGLKGDRVRISPSSPGLFKLMGVELLRGRGLMDGEGVGRDGQKAVVINESFAQEAFPEGQAVGRPIKLLRDAYTVVGVAADFQNAALREARMPQAFMHYRQLPLTWSTLLVRTGIEPGSVVKPLTRMLRESFKDLQWLEVASMDRLLVEALGPRTRAVTFTALFAAAMALLLAAVGTFGVVHGSVRNRTREIGVRLALGATRPRIAAMVLRRSLVLAAAGIALGTALGAALKQSLSAYLFQIHPADPYALAAAILTLLIAALAAHLPPLRYALNVDPVETLRHEQ